VGLDAQPPGQLQEPAPGPGLTFPEAALEGAEAPGRRRKLLGKLPECLVRLVAGTGDLAGRVVPILAVRPGGLELGLFLGSL